MNPVALTDLGCGVLPNQQVKSSPMHVNKPYQQTNKTSGTGKETRFDPITQTGAGLCLKIYLLKLN